MSELQTASPHHLCVCVHRSGCIVAVFAECGWIVSAAAGITVAVSNCVQHHRRAALAQDRPETHITLLDSLQLRAVPPALHALFILPPFYAYLAFSLALHHPICIPLSLSLTT